MKGFKIRPTEPCKGAVIFLHGIGDTGKGWAKVYLGTKTNIEIIISKLLSELGFVEISIGGFCGISRICGIQVP